MHQRSTTFTRHQEAYHKQVVYFQPMIAQGIGASLVQLLSVDPFGTWFLSLLPQDSLGTPSKNKIDKEKDQTNNDTREYFKHEFGLMHHFWHFWHLSILGAHEPRWMTVKTLQNTCKKIVHLLLILYHCFATWLAFDVSSFHLQQQSLQFVGHWFHYLLYDFHLNVITFLLQVLPKVILATGKVFTELEAPIHFVLEVFERFMSGDRGLHDNIFDYEIIGLYDCWAFGMIWVGILLEHPLLHFFSKTSQWTCWRCQGRCYDDARYSVSFDCGGSPMPSQLMEPPNHEAPSFMLHNLTNHTIA